MKWRFYRRAKNSKLTHWFVELIQTKRRLSTLKMVAKRRKNSQTGWFTIQFTNWEDFALWFILKFTSAKRNVDSIPWSQINQYLVSAVSAITTWWVDWGTVLNDDNLRALASQCNHNPLKQNRGQFTLNFLLWLFDTRLPNIVRSNCKLD